MRKLQCIERILTGKEPSSFNSMKQDILLSKNPSGRVLTHPNGVTDRRETGGESRGSNDESLISNFMSRSNGGAPLQLRNFLDDDDAMDYKISSAVDADTMCFLIVQFKNRKLKYASGFSLHPGEYVIVGGDRGEDIGMVVDVLDVREARGRGQGYKEGPGKALRKALAEEVHLLEEQREAEEVAIAWAKSATRKHMLLDMVIVDAEYQFDRRKLTFYYESPNRPDFRHLVRELYQRFHARIWMEKGRGGNDR